MIITRTDVLSGATPQQIREKAAGLDPARLADLAVQLAADTGLRVSVITYPDGTQALEVLRAAPPGRRTAATRPTGPPARTLSLATLPGLQAAIQLIHDTLQQASQPSGK